MELDAQDLKRGLKFIVGTWRVDYVVNVWSNDLAHIPASEFKSTDGNDFTAVSYTFFEDHTLVMKNDANGREERGTWEQTGFGEFHYTLNGFLDLQDNSFLKAAETLSMRDGEYLVFSLGFLAIAMKKTEEGTVTEEKDIGEREPSEADLQMNEIVGTYEIAKALTMVKDNFGLFTKEEVLEELNQRKEAGEITEEEIAQELNVFSGAVEFTEDHRVIQWMALPPGVPEEAVKAALEAGEIAGVKDGMFNAGRDKEWKALDGKYYYNSGEHREVFGEVQSPWDELVFDEDGLLSFGEAMKLRRK
ncbi:MAG: hypothetical protein IJM50_03275 [Lachnospiraceae bacterium]|nr:hypothetical protein [Lachnospiraceae bacterium]